LYHIKLILSVSIRISQILDKENTSVLLHCSDGWDRTSQLSGISQLILDPFYRTIKGFIILLEKEWLYFGHKFQVRCGHGEKSATDENNRAPIFLQFMDCIYQFLVQFPCSFEFSEKLLIEIMDSMYSCKYGTFLCNNQSERDQKNISNRTLSLWTHVLQHIQDYTNPFYVPTDVIYPDTSLCSLQLWSSYYLRHRTKKKEGALLTVEMRGWQLKLTCEDLYKRLTDLERVVTQSNVAYTKR